MKTFFFVACFIVLSFHIVAQDITIKTLQVESSKTIKADLADTIKKAWKAGGLYNLNVGQGTLSNWAAGGDDFSLTINSFLNLFSFYRNRKNSWDNSLDISLGYLKTTTLGSRKNDDRFDLLSKYGYALNPKLNVSALFDFRSQFLRGYTYTNQTKTFSSSFLAPGYLLVSTGFDWKPNQNLSIFFSPLTSRWVITKSVRVWRR